MSLSRRLFWSLVRAPKTLNTPNYTNKPLSTDSVLLKGAAATFDDVKTAKTRLKTTLVIDVRDLNEIKETGVIPGSINIPLAQVEAVLKNMPPEEFQRRYGRTKPSAATELIFYCKAGVRSGNAREVALKLGFKGAKNYEGGFQDWAKRIKE